MKQEDMKLLDLIELIGCDHPFTPDQFTFIKERVRVLVMTLSAVQQLLK